MDSTRTQPTADRVYEDFEPFHEWDRDQRLFSVLLPGYRRDQLKVQVTSKPSLRLLGERLITLNRWRRFNLEFPIPSDYDTDKVTAKFEGGRLSIQFDQLIKPKETTPEEAPTPQEPSQKLEQQKPAQEDIPKAKEDKAEDARTNGEVSDKKTPQKEEPVNETQKDKSETTETTEAATSQVPKPKNAKLVTRSKTRLIDFTLSFGASNQEDKEANGDSDAGLNKWKKRVKWMVLILLVVGLGLYARTALRTSHGESNFEFEEL